MFIVHTGGETLAKAVTLCGELRGCGISADLDPGSKGFKAQFKKADREGAAFALVIGENELAAGTCTVKDLKSGGQEAVSTGSIADYIREKLS